MTEYVLLAVDEKRKMIRVQGIETPFKPDDLQILVNGVDIMETIVLDSLLIIVKKNPSQPQQPPAMPIVPATP